VLTLRQLQDGLVTDHKKTHIKAGEWERRNIQESTQRVYLHTANSLADPQEYCVERILNQMGVLQ
jgi:hypothetical protein